MGHCIKSRFAIVSGRRGLLLFTFARCPERGSALRSFFLTDDVGLASIREVSRKSASRISNAGEREKCERVGERENQTAEKHALRQFTVGRASIDSTHYLILIRVSIRFSTVYQMTESWKAVAENGRHISIQKVIDA